jgi:hypothetical protein
MCPIGKVRPFAKVLENMKSSYNRLWSRILFLAFAGLAFGNSGCLLIAAGAAGGAAAGYAYYKGKIVEYYSAGLDDSWAATHTALGELGMPLVKEERGTQSASIESRTGDNEVVHIYLDAINSSIPADGRMTRISIRVATFGNGPVSDRVFYQIGTHLVPVNYVPPPVAQVPPAGAITPAGAVAPQQTAPPPLLPSAPEPIQK